MIIIDLLLFLLAIGIIVFFVTQVVIPYVQGTPFFPWVRHTPAVQMGQSQSGGAGTRAMDLVDLMTAKTAKELGVDMSVKAGAATKK